MKNLLLIVFLLLFLLSGCTSTTNNNISKYANVVSDGDIVTLEYKVNLTDGTEVDSSKERGPLTFTVGKHEIIIGLENAVKGMHLNEEKTFTLNENEAYGPYRKELLVEIPKSSFKNVEELKEGMIVAGPQGEKGLIVKIKDKTIVVDFNHPLAGKNLNFWVKVIKIQKKGG